MKSLITCRGCFGFAHGIKKCPTYKLLKELKLGNKVAQHCLYKKEKELSSYNNVTSWPYLNSASILDDVINNNADYLVLLKNFKK